MLPVTSYYQFLILHSAITLEKQAIDNVDCASESIKESERRREKIWQNYLKLVDNKVSNQLLCFAFAISLKMAYLGTNLKTTRFNCPEQVKKQTSQRYLKKPIFNCTTIPQPFKVTDNHRHRKIKMFSPSNTCIFSLTLLQLPRICKKLYLTDRNQDRTISGVSHC